MTARTARSGAVVTNWWRVAVVVLGCALAVALMVAVQAVRDGNAYAARHHVSDYRVKTVCAQYSGLDLSGLAGLCIDVGYQEGP